MDPEKNVLSEKATTKNYLIIGASTPYFVDSNDFDIYNRDHGRNLL
jgi:hypothetical protein